MEYIKYIEKHLISFKEAYNKAIEDDKEIFIFKGHEFLVSYAKYVIEYIESKSK